MDTKKSGDMCPYRQTYPAMYYWLHIFTICILLRQTDGQESFNLVVPVNYTVFSGPIPIQYTIPGNVTLQEGIIQTVSLKDASIIITTPIPVMFNQAEVSIYCGTVDYAGIYVFRMREREDSPVLVESAQMNVFWPRGTIILPRMHTALTTDVTMYVHVEEVACESERASSMYSIELVYYGLNETVVGNRPEPKQYPFREDVKRLGYLKTNVPKVLSCDVMDQGGIYRGRLVAIDHEEHPVVVSEVMNVAWSVEYRLTTLRNSIFPCELNFPVQYSQPQCSGNNDKIRLYEQTQTDSSMASPIELVYLAEKRASKRTNMAVFPCDKFEVEAYGYCFKYVLTARNGAVHEQKAICVPTEDVPVGTVVDGSWGNWVDWSACTAKCGLGKQNRYRTCDNPPPSKGGMYCEGDSVQYRLCENNCAVSTTPLSHYTPDPACDCGCEILAEPDGRIVSSIRCPGSSMWTIRAKPHHRIELKFEVFTLVSANQETWIKIRNGDSYMSDLLLYNFGGTKPGAIRTSGNAMLIEFFTPYELSAYAINERFVAVFKSFMTNGTAVFIPEAEAGTSVWESTITIVGITLCAVIVICTIAFVCHNRRMKARKQQRKAHHQALLSNGEVAVSPTHSIHSVQGSNNVSYGDPASPTKRQYVVAKGVCTHPQGPHSRRSSHSRKGSVGTPGSGGYQGSVPSPYAANADMKDYVHDPKMLRISPIPVDDGPSRVHKQHRRPSPHSPPVSPTHAVSSHGTRSPTKSQGSIRSGSPPGSITSRSRSKAPRDDTSAPLADLEDISPMSHASPLHKPNKYKMTRISEHIPMDSYSDRERRPRAGVEETPMEQRPPVEGRDSLTRKKSPSDLREQGTHTGKPRISDEDNGNYANTRPNIKPLPLRSVQRPDGQSPENKPVDPNANTPTSLMSDLSPFHKSKLFPDQGTSRTPSEVVFMDQDFEYDDYMPDLPGSYFTMDPNAYTLSWSQQTPWAQAKLAAGSQPGSMASVRTHDNIGTTGDKGSSHC